MRQARIKLYFEHTADRIEVSQQTYYRWRQKYGGMSPDMIKQLRLLQKENKRLTIGANGRTAFSVKTANYYAVSQAGPAYIPASTVGKFRS
jgi:hypothetical protein